MFTKIKIGSFLVLIVAAVLLLTPHPVPLDAQTPPIPTGQIAVTGIGSSTTTAFLGAMTGITPAASAILLAAPTTGGTVNGQLRNYVYQVQCVSSSATATLAVLIDSSATGAAPGRTQIGYTNCPASAAANSVTSFNPPLALRPGSALGISSQVAVTTAFFFASGFVGR